MKIFYSIFFLFILLFSNISYWTDIKYNYPIYYWTKKCEINTKKETKTYAFFQNEENSIYYLENWNLYKNSKIYKKWVEYIFIEFNGNIIYWVNNWKKIDIYKNNKKLITIDSFSYRSFYYDKYLDKYSLEVTINLKDYFFSNWNLFSYNDFLYHDRYFSENKQYFVDYYYNDSWFKVIKDWKILIERKNSYISDFINISNDWKSYSANIQDKRKYYSTFIKNWKITGLENVYFFKYSPSWKDLYYIIKNWDNNIFYKNDEKILEMKWVVYNSINFHFINENNFYTILTNWDDYAFIENGKIRISYDDKNQIKTIIKKTNWDVFVVKRDKNIWKDIFEINWKKIMEAKNIDERYLNDWIDTFSLYSNRNNSNQYYTYLKTDDNYYLYVNGFIIPNFYDYLELKNWLDNFNFASNSSQWNIVCKDITNSFPDINYKREYFEKLLLKIKDFDENKKNLLKKKLENILTKQIKQKNIEIIKMFLDNLNFKNPI